MHDLRVALATTRAYIASAARDNRYHSINRLPSKTLQRIYILYVCWPRCTRGNTSYRCHFPDLHTLAHRFAQLSRSVDELRTHSLIVGDVPSSGDTPRDPRATAWQTGVFGSQPAGSRRSHQALREFRSGHLTPHGPRSHPHALEQRVLYLAPDLEAGNMPRRSSR